MSQNFLDLNPNSTISYDLLKKNFPNDLQKILTLDFDILNKKFLQQELTAPQELMVIRKKFWYEYLYKQFPDFSPMSFEQIVLNEEGKPYENWKEIFLAYKAEIDKKKDLMYRLYALNKQITPSQFPQERLPKELRDMIISFVPGENIVDFCAKTKGMEEICDDENSILWKDLYRRDCSKYPLEDLISKKGKYIQYYQLSIDAAGNYFNEIIINSDDRRGIAKLISYKTNYLIYLQILKWPNHTDLSIISEKFPVFSKLNMEIAALKIFNLIENASEYGYYRSIPNYIFLAYSKAASFLNIEILEIIIKKLSITQMADLILTKNWESFEKAVKVYEYLHNMYPEFKIVLSNEIIISGFINLNYENFVYLVENFSYSEVLNFNTLIIDIMFNIVFKVGKFNSPNPSEDELKKLNYLINKIDNLSFEFMEPLNPTSYHEYYYKKNYSYDETKNTNLLSYEELAYPQIIFNYNLYNFILELSLRKNLLYTKEQIEGILNLVKKVKLDLEDSFERGFPKGRISDEILAYVKEFRNKTKNDLIQDRLKAIENLGYTQEALENYLTYLE